MDTIKFSLIQKSTLQAVCENTQKSVLYVESVLQQFLIDFSIALQSGEHVLLDPIGTFSQSHGQMLFVALPWMHQLENSCVAQKKNKKKNKMRDAFLGIEFFSKKVRLSRRLYGREKEFQAIIKSYLCTLVEGFVAYGYMYLPKIGSVVKIEELIYFYPRVDLPNSPVYPSLKWDFFKKI